VNRVTLDTDVVAQVAKWRLEVDAELAGDRCAVGRSNTETKAAWRQRGDDAHLLHCYQRMPLEEGHDRGAQADALGLRSSG
jgi:hypothetical protein